MTENIFITRRVEDIYRSSLERRNPLEQKNEELRFWLKYRNDLAKGLRTKILKLKKRRAFIMSAFELCVSRFFPHGKIQTCYSM